VGSPGLHAYRSDPDTIRIIWSPRPAITSLTLNSRPSGRGWVPEERVTWRSSALIEASPAGDRAHGARRENLTCDWVTNVHGPETSLRARSLETAPAEGAVSRRPDGPQIPDREPSPPPRRLPVESRQSAVVCRPGGAKYERHPFECVLAEKAITPFLPPRSSNRK
jgi:hypothetical protein